MSVIAVNNLILNCLVGISLDWSEKIRICSFGITIPGWFCVPLKDSQAGVFWQKAIFRDLRGMIPQSAVDTAMASTLINFYEIWFTKPYKRHNLLKLTAVAHSPVLKAPSLAVCGSWKSPFPLFCVAWQENFEMLLVLFFIQSK